MRVKTQAKRLAILEAAKGVFLERGFSDASMAEVAARVGGSKQTLYSYFSSKDELFVAMMIEKGAVMIEPLFDIFNNSPHLLAALTDFSFGFIRFASDVEILALRRIICAEGSKSNLGKLFFESGPKRGWTRMAEEFQRAMNLGHMRCADTWMAVQHFRGLCEAGPIQNLLEGAVTSVTDEDLIQAAEAAVDVFIRAYDIKR
jgi:AcrR family transcriptional regulator